MLLRGSPDEKAPVWEMLDRMDAGACKAVDVRCIQRDIDFRLELQGRELGERTGAHGGWDPNGDFEVVGFIAWGKGGHREDST